MNPKGRSRLVALQRAISRPIAPPNAEPDRYATSSKLRLDMLSTISEAFDADRLDTSDFQASALIKLLSAEKALSPQDQREIPAGRKAEVLLVGGVPASTDFQRQSREKHVVRRDGASFTARWIVASDPQGVEVLAYGAELWWSDFDSKTATNRWIRWDMNVREHPNDVRGMRAHMHVGSDDWSLPAPEFRPLELLTVLLYAGTELTGDDVE